MKKKPKIMTYNPKDFKAGKFKVPKCLKGKLPKGVKSAAKINTLFEHNFSMIPSFWALAKPKKVRKPMDLNLEDPGICARFLNANKYYDNIQPDDYKYFDGVCQYVANIEIDYSDSGFETADECRAASKKLAAAASWLLRAADYLEYKARKK